MLGAGCSGILDEVAQELAGDLDRAIRRSQVGADIQA